jgi:3-hydroxy-9,10-secoandrosta-1,3,5(10)-triene-9,17-dione monooxygenase reductase component
VEAADFRRLMGYWATGVSVITARAADGPAGVTANAVSSLSLDPPLALVCFDLSSRTLHAVRASERFCINMLAAGQEDVSRVFATKRSHVEKFAEITHRDAYDVPVIDGCVAWLACALESEFRRGDHIVAIGKVLAGDADSAAAPLVFHRGAYTTLPVGADVTEPAVAERGSQSGVT